MISPSGGDDTPIIQAALNAKGYAELDAGNFLITSLDLADSQGLCLRGQGSLITKLQPTQSGVNVLDCTGTSNVTLRDFRIAGTGAGVTPNTGILCAQKQGSAGADVFALDGVRVDGNFGVAAFYCVGVQSSRMVGGQFYNYQPSAMTAIFNGTNMFGVTSQFTQISSANDMQASDWTMLACEFHNMASGWAVWMGGGDSLRWFGGNMSSSGLIFTSNAIVMQQGTMFPTNNIIDGVTFYADFPPVPAYAVSGQHAPHQIAFRNCSHPGMSLTGP